MKQGNTRSLWWPRVSGEYATGSGQTWSDWSVDGKAGCGWTCKCRE